MLLTAIALIIVTSLVTTHQTSVSYPLKTSTSRVGSKCSAIFENRCALLVFGDLIDQNSKVEFIKHRYSTKIVSFVFKLN